MSEFSGVRAKLYKESFWDFPDARNEDIKIMKKYLAPKSNETILEVGAGTGLFSKILSDILEKGKLITSDPSEEQLEEIIKLEKKNVKVLVENAENVILGEKTVDAIWSFGAIHHCFNKTKAFHNFSRMLKKGGRIVLADVYVGSKLAKHFDKQVAKFGVTGHEVAFLSKEFAESLCYTSGLEKPKFYDVNIQWKFNTKNDLGLFLYKLHGMTKTNPKKCLEGAEKILGVKKKGKQYYLNWPLTIMVSKKK